MQLVQQITMDFAVHGVPPRIFGKQDDSLSRAAQISLFNAGAPWPIPTGAAMMLRYRTSSGAIGLYDTLPAGTSPFSVEKNIVTVVLVDQIFAASGLTECELRIAAEGAGVSTWTFLVDVERSASGDTTIPSDYINVLVNLANQVAADAKRAQDAANSVDTTYLMNKTMYDPTGIVESTGGIPQYVATNAPKVKVEDSVSSASTTNAASSNSVKKAYDLANAAIPAKQKGAASGVASLGADGKLLSSQLPAGFSGVEILDSQVIVFGTGIGSGSMTDLNVVKANGIVIVTGNLIFAPSQAKSAYSIGLSGLPPVAGRGLSIVDASWLIGGTSKPTLQASASIQTNGITSNNGNSPMLNIWFESNLGIQNYGLYMTLIYATT